MPTYLYSDSYECSDDNQPKHPEIAAKRWKDASIVSNSRKRNRPGQSSAIPATQRILIWSSGTSVLDSSLAIKLVKASNLFEMFVSQNDVAEH